MKVSPAKICPAQVCRFQIRPNIWMSLSPGIPRLNAAAQDRKLFFVCHATTCRDSWARLTRREM
jgi:hypothetical protein